jgi:enolase
MIIQNIQAKQIFDSKNHPTIEAMVILGDGQSFVAASPSGASTGTTEAVEIPVERALSAITNIIKPALLGKDTTNQRTLDSIMISLDGTPNKSNLGGNATTAVSMALAKAGAHAKNISLYQYFGLLTGNTTLQLPTPLFLVMEGGKHGNWATDIQEFMIIPNAQTYPTFQNRFDVCNSGFTMLEHILQEKKYSQTIGFEGAFCPKELSNNEEAMALVTTAIEKTGLVPGKDMSIAIDAAASEFIKKIDSTAWMEQIIGWAKKYPLISLEDMFDQEDWNNWTKLTTTLGNDHLIVGDDLVTTNVVRLQKAIDVQAINSCIIKVNQIGTISETLDAIQLAHKAHITTIISHRGGETMDTTIADLVVGTSTYCKFGGPRKPERMAKYNRLFAIEKELQ